MTVATDPADLTAAARTIRDADRVTRGGWPLGDDVTREVVVAATSVLAAVDALTDEVECHRDAARRAHDRLVSEAVVMMWATDGRLDTAVRHAVEYIRRLQSERNAARHARLTAVRALHHRRPHRTGDLLDFGQTEFPDLCDHCRTRWPCATIRIMGIDAGPGAPSAGGVGSEGVGDAERPGEGRGA